MVRTTVNGAQTNLLYDGQNLAAEYDATGKLTQRYVFGPGVDAPLVQYEGTATNAKSWLYANQQGSVVAQANGTGATIASQAYGPFGETDGTPASRFGYTGQQYLAPLGLYYYKARMYSPALGRFLQTDPVGYKDDLNWYAYVGNNPVNFSDPTGLTCYASQFAQAGATIGAVMGGGTAIAGSVALNVATGGVNIIATPHEVAAGAAGGAALGGAIGYGVGSLVDHITYAKPPENAYDPEGPKAPGKPGADVGFKDPKGGDNWVPNPNGRGHGWLDANGKVWVPTGQGGGAHGGPHWDVQAPGGGYENVRPKLP